MGHLGAAFSKVALTRLCLRGRGLRLSLGGRITALVGRSLRRLGDPLLRRDGIDSVDPVREGALVVVGGLLERLDGRVAQLALGGDGLTDLGVTRLDVV